MLWIKSEQHHSLNKEPYMNMVCILFLRVLVTLGLMIFAQSFYILHDEFWNNVLFTHEKNSVTLFSLTAYRAFSLLFLVAIMIYDFNWKMLLKKVIPPYSFFKDSWCNFLQVITFLKTVTWNELTQFGKN